MLISSRRSCEGIRISMVKGRSLRLRLFQENEGNRMPRWRRRKGNDGDG